MKTIIIALVAVFGLVGVASAQESLAVANQNRCGLIQARIQNRAVNYDNSKAKHLSAYNNLKDRLIKFEARLSGKGFDTTTLKADMAVLNGKIDQFAADYGLYMSRLRETQNYACGKSDGEFKTKLSESRNLLLKVHEDSKAIREYYASNIKTDLKNLQAQIRIKVQEGEDK
ncbi:MAG: hypothetical protein AAB791_00425 [Patescibacteria group bacterium]